ARYRARGGRRAPGAPRASAPGCLGARAPRPPDRIGATLLLEALNRPESPDYPLVTAASAVEVADKVNAATGLGNAKFLLDLYHLARNGEDLGAAIAAYADRVGHVQIADDPGRGAPGTGTLPLERLLDDLTAAGYPGWVGLEYKPGDRPSAESFDWLPYEARAARA
ncbi:TIM barrel protein, partial [Streptomyces sp. NPDC058953]|uniref:TIM barrel protein n=1 Tax=Streptomyces sp. NPDC058953 TaxID=3346676 RepID=UPI00369DE6E0